jgi:hypothetical protein
LVGGAAVRRANTKFDARFVAGRSCFDDRRVTPVPATQRRGSQLSAGHCLTAVRDNRPGDQNVRVKPDLKLRPYSSPYSHSMISHARNPLF